MNVILDYYHIEIIIILLIKNVKWYKNKHSDLSYISNFASTDDWGIRT
jgi:hypothetical protein